MQHNRRTITIKRFVRPAITAGFRSLVSVCLLTGVKVTATFTDEPRQDFWGFPFPWLKDNIGLSLAYDVHVGLFLLNFLILFALWMLAARFVPSPIKGRAGRVVARGGAFVAILYLASFGLTFWLLDFYFCILCGLDDWFAFSHNSLIGYGYGIGLP